MMSDEKNILTRKKFLTEEEALETAHKCKDEVVVDKKRNALIEKPEGEKTLFEQLEENRNKMIDDFEEYFKLRNRAYSGLTEEERIFMIQLKQFHFKRARDEEERANEEVEQFKLNSTKIKKLPEIEEIKTQSFEIKPLRAIYVNKQKKLKKADMVEFEENPKVDDNPELDNKPVTRGLVTYSGSESDSDL